MPVGSRHGNRDREQRRGLRRRAKSVSEALVGGELRRSDRPPLPRRVLQHLGARGKTLGEEVDEPMGQGMPSGQAVAVSARGQHRRPVAAERLRRSQSDGVECGGQGHGLAEQARNPREASLDSRLPLALAEALRVAEGERSQRCEARERVEVALPEHPPRVARADTQDSSCLTAPRHRGDDRRGEILVGRVRHGLKDAAVAVLHHRRAPGDRTSGETLTGGKLEADEAPVEPVNGRASERRAVGAEQVAICRVRLEEKRDLIDEQLKDDLDVEFPRHDLRGFQQRALLAEPELVLAEQTGGVNAEANLPGDCLGQAPLGRRPRTRLGAMECEYADRLFEDDDRGGEDRSRAEPDQELAAAVVELGGHVRDRDRLSHSQRLVRHRELVGDVGRERRDALAGRFGSDRRRLALGTQPHDAPREPERTPDLLDGDAEERIEVELGANLPRDRGDEPFALQRLFEGGGGAGALEGQRRLGSERPKRPELLGGEDAALVRGGDGEDGDHALSRDERDECGAARPDRLGDRLVDQRRGPGVVDRDGGNVEDGARHP